MEYTNKGGTKKRRQTLNKAGTLLAAQIPSWKLFSRLSYMLAQSVQLWKRHHKPG